MSNSKCYSELGESWGHAFSTTCERRGDKREYDYRTWNSAYCLRLPLGHREQLENSLFPSLAGIEQQQIIECAMKPTPSRLSAVVTSLSLILITLPPYLAPEASFLSHSSSGELFSPFFLSTAEPRVESFEEKKRKKEKKVQKESISPNTDLGSKMPFHIGSNNKHPDRN